MQKIINENATGIVVVAFWNSQTWYPLHKKLLIEEPLIFQPNHKLLLSPYRFIIHPLADRLTILAGKLCGNRINARE